MTRNMIISIVAGFVITFGIAAVGVQALLGEYAAQTMRKDIEVALTSGDYAAALGYLTDLEADVGADTEIEAQRTLAATFLVATANYEKAKVAADNGE